MVIEWLKFQVPAERREEFVQKDNEIWTPVLASSPGFLGKEVWISSDQATEVIVVVRWETFELWQSIPPEQLEPVEARFSEALDGEYELLESKAFQVRKYLGS